MSRRNLGFIFAAVFATSALSAGQSPVDASTNWSELVKLTASDAAPGDKYGEQVDFDGGTALVGASWDDDNGTESGSAYVITGIGGTRQEAKLTPSDGASQDFFGYSVALDGDTAVVGAIRDDDSAPNGGSVYVFVRSGGTWSQQAKLTASDGASQDSFGTAVDISGDTVVVGASSDDDSGADSGSAYVFVRSGVTWTEQAKLTAIDGAAQDRFGDWVAIDGDSVVVGAYGDDDAGDLSGSAYVFVRSGVTWTQQAKLQADDAAAGDQFGYGVAVSGETAVVGAFRSDANGFNSGSAYVFVRSGGTWSQQAKLTGSDTTAGDAFGNSVAVHGDTALVGAVGDDDGGANSGSAYLFSRSGSVWTEQAKVVANDDQEGDFLGSSVAIDGAQILVGAGGEDSGGADTGAAYVFEEGPAPAPGFLRVVTDPALPAQISVDGQWRDTWGLTWVKLTPGTYEVCFSDIAGFSTPPCEQVVVTGGQTTVVTGSYSARGYLRVLTDPALPATISVDGVPRNDWGMWTDLPPGTYEVCFGAVDGFVAPPCEQVAVAAGVTATVTGDYTAGGGGSAVSGEGFLRVTTSPALPSQILVDGVPMDTWGLTWVKVPPGTYTVAFTDVAGFDTPAPQQVSVTAGQTSEVVGVFAARGYLRASTSPAAPATVSVDGVPRNDWGMWTDVPPGTYEVCFGDVDGLTTPPCQQATVTAAVTTDVVGTFTP